MCALQPEAALWMYTLRHCTTFCWSWCFKLWFYCLYGEKHALIVVKQVTKTRNNTSYKPKNSPKEVLILRKLEVLLYTKEVWRKKTQIFQPLWQCWFLKFKAQLLHPPHHASPKKGGFCLCIRQKLKWRGDNQFSQEELLKLGVVYAGFSDLKLYLPSLFPVFFFLQRNALDIQVVGKADLKS